MSYSEGGLAVVNNGRNGLLGYDLASGCNAEDAIFTAVLENISFIVKTFESNDTNSSETKRQTELNGFHLLDKFEDSYFSLVNDKIKRLEGKQIKKPVRERSHAVEKDSGEIVSILGDVWIAEFLVPVDLGLFKKILTDAVYTVSPNLVVFDDNDTQPLASEDPIDGKKSRKTINYVNNTNSHTNNYSKSREVDFDNLKAAEEPASIDKEDDVIDSPPNPVKEKTGGRGRRKGPKPTRGRKGRPRSLKPIFLDETPEPKSKKIEEENDQEQEDKEEEELVEKVDVEQVEEEEDVHEDDDDVEEDSDSDEEFELPKRTYRRRDKPNRPVDGSNTDYLKSKHFAQLLANCPFFSGHSVSNAAIASKKASSIIDKLTKDAQIWKSKSPEDESEVSDSGYLSTDAIQRAAESYELMELNGDLFTIADTVKRRTKKRYRRIYSPIPRHLKSSKNRARHSYLQKLNVLVDRITSKYINKKKKEIMSENFYQTFPDTTEYVTGTHGWNHDPYRSNRQGRIKGHGLYLSCGDYSTLQTLEQKLNDPFNIPWVSMDRIGYRDIIKRMFQDY